MVRSLPVWFFVALMVASCGSGGKKLMPVPDSGTPLPMDTCIDNDGDGAVGTGDCSMVPAAERDCDDNDPSVHPGAVEICDGIDNNCNGMKDEGLTTSAYYEDKDGDGIGSSVKVGEGCMTPPVGTVSTTGDCNDNDMDIRPGVAEVCNDIDDDCDGQKDNGLPFQDYYVDADGDGFGDAAGAPLSSCRPVMGRVANKADCNDNNPTVKPGVAELCNKVDDNCDGQIDNGITFQNYYPDVDGDGFGSDSAVAESACATVAGKVTNNADCNDANPTVKPGAPESCNSIDDNCNGQIDEGLTFATYYPDADGDGFGQAGSTGQSSCVAVAGKVTNSTDCNDSNPTVKPTAVEMCNGVDDNCNGSIDDGLTFQSYFIDMDGDGFGAGVGTSACAPIAGRVTNNTDCNDANASIKPNAPEVCNGIDDNCNAQVDDGLTFLNYYPDGDGDGFGNKNATATSSCSPISGRVTNNLDCNDALFAVKPGATEVCNGIDDNCNNSIDEGLTFVNYYSDLDGDTFGAGAAQSACQVVAGKVTNNSDCNDTNPAVKPGATELCNSVDDNCNGSTDEGLTFTNYYSDNDGDGYGAGGLVSACAPVAGKVTNNTDCNDAVATIHPGAVETCNLIDDNCDSLIDNGTVTQNYYPDLDGDGYGAASGTPIASCSPVAGRASNNTDCNDSAGAIHPGAIEICNGVDDNCAAGIDEGLTFINYYPDVDGDGFGSAAAAAQSACAPVSGKVTSNTDCNDSVAAVHPGATEICNGVDDNCAGGIDDGLTFLSYYPDVDGDGFGSSSAGAQSACGPVAGKVTSNTDCNDSNGTIHPGATEVCNFLDDNCAGGVDEGLPTQNYYTDADGDGFGATTATAQASCGPITGKVTNKTDCNDGNANIRPNATETCNNIDDNCNAQIDEGNPGGGGACSTGQSGVCAAGTLTCTSGTVTCVRNVAPSTEKCNNLDDNCDGVTDESFSTKGQPCSAGLGVCLRNGTFVCTADQLAVTCSVVAGPQTTPACDGLDNDCDGVVDEPGLASTTDINTPTAWSDIEVEPYYYSSGSCKGGLNGGTDALAGGAMAMGGGTAGFNFQPLNSSGAPVGSPTQAAPFSYADVDLAQAGDGFILGGIYLLGADTYSIDLYYMDAVTGAQRAYLYDRYIHTGTNILDSLRLVRANGARVVVLWREAGIGIRMARFEPFFDTTLATPAWTIREVGTAQTFPNTSTYGPGLGADSNHEDWVATQTCPAASALRQVGIAWSTTPTSINHFTVNEDFSGKSAEVVARSVAAPRTIDSPEETFFRSASADQYFVANVMRDTSANEADLEFWMTTSPSYHFAYLAYATDNGTASIQRPRASATATEVWMSAVRFDIDLTGSTFHKQVMTRRTDFTGAKNPSAYSVELSATTGSCGGQAASCRPGDKDAFTNWAQFGRLYYSGSGSSPVGTYTSVLTCN